MKYDFIAHKAKNPFFNEAHTLFKRCNRVSQQYYKTPMKYSMGPIECNYFRNKSSISKRAFIKNLTYEIWQLKPIVNDTMQYQTAQRIRLRTGAKSNLKFIPCTLFDTPNPLYRWRWICLGFLFVGGLIAFVNISSLHNFKWDVTNECGGSRHNTGY